MFYIHDFGIKTLHLTFQKIFFKTIEIFFNVKKIWIQKLDSKIFKILKVIEIVKKREKKKLLKVPQETVRRVPLV